MDYNFKLNTSFFNDSGFFVVFLFFLLLFGFGCSLTKVPTFGF